MGAVLVAGATVADPPLAAGTATVFEETRDAFGLPAPSLNPAHRASFFVGNSYFNENWTAAPGSVKTRDGLGPLYNARSCSACHFKDGRSRPPEPGAAMTTMLLRISVPGHGPHGEPKGDPIYGDQIQGAALPGLAREADVLVEYEEVPGHFADGEGWALRRPRYRLRELGYGAPSAKLLTSPRVAPAMVGLGLLEAVPEGTLREHEDPEDRDGDGISGRLNQVWDQARKAPAIGRFGWKAEQPSVLQQSAGAFLGDMGITSSLFPGPGPTPRQTACAAAPSGGSPEVDDDILHSVALYARTLGVPAQRRAAEPEVVRGGRLFAEARCTACHLPALETGDAADLPELSHQQIRPYTDLLLHDMGAGLADGRPAFAAGGSEWRTPPLWGVGLVSKVNGHTFLLHDGRARGFAEAVLWHGGEAAKAREAFVRMPRADRRAVIAFLESL
jgi:CxxC motif-containing protein (DUF1111 family)